MSMFHNGRCVDFNGGTLTVDGGTLGNGSNTNSSVQYNCVTLAGKTTFTVKGYGRLLCGSKCGRAVQVSDTAADSRLTFQDHADFFHLATGAYDAIPIFATGCSVTWKTAYRGLTTANHLVNSTQSYSCSATKGTFGCANGSIFGGTHTGSSYTATSSSSCTFYYMNTYNGWTSTNKTVKKIDVGL